MTADVEPGLSLGWLSVTVLILVPGKFGGWKS